MVHLFWELCKNHFQIPFLEDQLKEFSTAEEAKLYINYIMNEFEKKQIHDWMRTIELHNETGKLYGYDDLDLGTFGFYIVNPDEDVSFYETTYGMKLEMSLNDFIRQCERLLKYYKHEQNITKSGCLKIAQIALIYVYNGNPITRANGDEIARLYKHTSGEKLYQKYNELFKRTSRIGEPESPSLLKIKNKIKLMESILPHLTDTAKLTANDEIQHMKTTYKKYEKLKYDT